MKLEEALLFFREVSDLGWAARIDAQLHQRLHENTTSPGATTFMLS